MCVCWEDRERVEQGPFEVREDGEKAGRWVVGPGRRVGLACVM